MSWIFTSPATAEIVIYKEGSDGKPCPPASKDEVLVYSNSETIRGKTTIRVNKNKVLEHQGIYIYFLGQIDFEYNRTDNREILNVSKQVCQPGRLITNHTSEFEFSNVKKGLESYHGTNVRVKYYVKTVLMRSYLPNITAEKEVKIVSYKTLAPKNVPLNIEVGIEGSLQLRLSYLKSAYHLEDVVLAKIHFLIMRLRVKVAMITLQRREVTGVYPDAHIQVDELGKFEIMDGIPVKSVVIPVRFFLESYKLTPTYECHNEGFSVKYYFNLMLMDNDNRLYFKQHEIKFWRKDPNVQIEPETNIQKIYSLKFPKNPAVKATGQKSA